MADLNIVPYVFLSAIGVVVVQIHSIPVERTWLVDATNSIKESLNQVEACRLLYKNDDKIKMIADGAFDNFTSFAEGALSEMIKEVDGIESEEALLLETKLTKWLKDLRSLKYEESDTTVKKNEEVVGKFFKTMDYVSNEVVGFYNNYNTESTESKQFIDKLESLTERTIFKLTECAESVKNQVVDPIEDTATIDYVV